jgi:hypothetical protein
MPARLRARVSRLGGFPRPFSGLLLPPAGAFVITGQAVTSRSRSSPIRMGWWPAQFNDVTKALTAAGRAHKHHQKCKKGSTKRGIIVQTRASSPNIWEAFTLFVNEDARCGSKPARWRCRVPSPRSRCAMRFQKSQPAGAAKLVPPSASTGLLKIWMHHPPHEKRTRTKFSRKNSLEIALLPRFESIV